MPAMRRHGRGRRVVAGDRNNVCFEIEQSRNTLVEFLQRLYLGAEVSILPCRVSGLVVDEEEVVLI